MGKYADSLTAAAPAGVAPARRTKIAQPTGFNYEWDGTEGFIQTGALTERPRTWDAFIKDCGLDPDEVEVVEPVQVRGWDAPAGSGLVVRMHYYRLTVRRRSPLDHLDLPSLFAMAKKARRKPKERPERPERAVCVAYADPQTGKVASRGGTPELIERSAETLGLLEEYCDQVDADAAYLLDAGDAVEGFENTLGQMGTNDLSLMRQVEVASDLLFAFTDLLARKYPAVVVGGVGSNHCRWRIGKAALGSPADDWGLHMLRQLRKALAINPASYGHVDVVWPQEHEETLSLDICGTIVGLAHGHQATRPEGIPLWWAKQTHGGQPIAHADILVTGHFHSFRTESTGRSVFADKEKRWFQAPTMDNGSDWYRYSAGSDSDPGLLVFTVDKNGWDNLKVLRPGGKAG